MYEHYSYKKDVWTEFINGVEGMKVVYKLALSELLNTKTGVNDWMNNRNPRNKFSVSSHELCEHSLSYMGALH